MGAGSAGGGGGRRCRSPLQLRSHFQSPSLVREDLEPQDARAAVLAPAASPLARCGRPVQFPLTVRAAAAVPTGSACSPTERVGVAMEERRLGRTESRTRWMAAQTRGGEWGLEEEERECDWG